MDHTKFCTEIEVVTDVIRRSVASNEHNRLILKKANLVNGFYNKNDVKCDRLVTDVCNFRDFVIVLFFDSLFFQKSNIIAMIIKSLHFCLNWALLLHEIWKLYHYFDIRILKSIRQRKVQENLPTSTWSYHGIGSYEKLKLYTLHQYERKELVLCQILRI